MHTKYFKCAGITVEVRSDFPISENTFHPKFREFEVDGPGEDNVLIHHHFYKPNLPVNLEASGKEIYNKDQWRIFRADNSWIYDFKSLLPFDPGHSAVGVFNEEHTSLSAYTADFNKESYQNACFQALTLFNSDQVLFSKLLSDRGGMIFHSNGFDIDGNGILLAGKSGSGKSTLSEMLKGYGHKILCDDKMFMTAGKTGFHIHGNWCHGSMPYTSPSSAPLKAILFIEQSTDNFINVIEDKKSISHHLLRALVQPLLSPIGWGKIFDSTERMVRQVKCYHVKFDLSGKICEMVRNLSESL